MTVTAHFAPAAIPESGVSGARVPAASAAGATGRTAAAGDRFANDSDHDGRLVSVVA